MLSRIAIVLTLLCVGGALALDCTSVLSVGDCLCVPVGIELAPVYGERNPFFRLLHGKLPDGHNILHKAYHGECFMYTGFKYEDFAAPGCFLQVAFDNDGIVGWMHAGDLETTDHECPVPPKMVQRYGTRGWGALEPRRNIPHFKPKAVKCVIIHRTATNHCKSKHQCMAVVKEQQRKHMKEEGLADIRNNFYVGEDGRVYVGRGWRHIPASTAGYNHCCLGISVIDRFMEKIPKEPALEALQTLIASGVAKGFIDPDYELCTHHVVDGRQGPGRSFIDLLSKAVVVPRPSHLAVPHPYQPWPHYVSQCPDCDKP